MPLYGSLRDQPGDTPMKPFAFIFPGQGSQSVGMLDGWADDAVVAETVREASDALGEDLGKLVREGPKEALALTTNTQPVMLVAGVAAYRVWMSRTGIAPLAVAGRWHRACCSVECDEGYHALLTRDKWSQAT